MTLFRRKGRECVSQEKSIIEFKGRGERWKEKKKGGVIVVLLVGGGGRCKTVGASRKK